MNPFKKGFFSAQKNVKKKMTMNNSDDYTFYPNFFTEMDFPAFTIQGRTTTPIYQSLELGSVIYRTLFYTIMCWRVDNNRLFERLDVINANAVPLKFKLSLQAVEMAEALQTAISHPEWLPSSQQVGEPSYLPGLIYLVDLTVKSSQQRPLQLFKHFNYERPNPSYWSNPNSFLDNVLDNVDEFATEHQKYTASFT